MTGLREAVLALLETSIEGEDGEYVKNAAFVQRDKLRALRAAYDETPSPTCRWPDCKADLQIIRVVQKERQPFQFDEPPV